MKLLCRCGPLQTDFKMMSKQNGQVVIIVLLVMVVILVVALSAIGRSITEISTATRTEESSRAFSAAEAGIEQALQVTDRTGSSTVGNLTNNSQAEVTWNADLPISGMPLEHDPIGKESFAQFWLANPENLSAEYTQGSFQFFFGKPRDYSADLENKPAVEVRVVLMTPSGGYYSNEYYYDSSNGPGRAEGNGFNYASGCSASGIELTTDDSTRPSKFYCQVNVPPSGSYKNAANDRPIMVRIRLLYTNDHHPLAVKPTGTDALPYQKSIFRSIGTSGSSQRAVKVSQQKFVLPPFLDFALFTASTVTKR